MAPKVLYRHSDPKDSSLSSRLALLLQLSVMLSLPKIALFSLISFATLALAITAPEPRSVNARALFTAANVQIVNTMYPIDSSTFISFSSTLLYTYGLRIAYVTPSNNTAANIGPILTEVTSIVNKFIIALKGSNLDCSAQEILELAADLIKVLLSSSGFPLEGHVSWDRLSLIH